LRVSDFLSAEKKKAQAHCKVSESLVRELVCLPTCPVKVLMGLRLEWTTAGHLRSRTLVCSARLRLVPHPPTHPPTHPHTSSVSLSFARCLVKCFRAAAALLASMPPASALEFGRAVPASTHVRIVACMCICRAGRNHICAVYSDNPCGEDRIYVYTAYIYGFGQPYVFVRGRT